RSSVLLASFVSSATLAVRRDRSHARASSTSYFGQLVLACPPSVGLVGHPRRIKASSSATVRDGASLASSARLASIWVWISAAGFTVLRVSRSRLAVS